MIITGQVVAFSSLSGLEQELQDLEGHLSYAKEKAEYHKDKWGFYSLKAREIERAMFGKLEDIQEAHQKPQEQVTESSESKVEPHNGTSVHLSENTHRLSEENCIYFDWQRYPQKCGTRNDIGKLVTHKGFGSEYHDSLMSFAYYIGGNDFLLTLNAESGSRNKDQLSHRVGANGYRDQGLCQLNRKYHIDFINSEDFTDPYKQIRYCYDVYTDAMKKGRIKTTFYGYNVRHQRNNGIVIH